MESLSDTRVPNGPFKLWLLKQDRRAWGHRLNDSQTRYVERCLQRPEESRVSPYAIDSIFVTLDKPWLLNHLYADA